MLLPRQRQAVQVAASLAPESVEAPNFDEATNPTEAFLAWYRSLPTKAQRELKTRLLYVLIALGGVMVEIRERDAVRLFVALAVFALTLYELRNKLDEISRS